MNAGDDLRNAPVGELLKRLSSETALLVRQELELARAELIEKAMVAGAGAGMLSGAAVAGLLTLASLTALAMLALSIVMAPWLAALIVTVIWGVVTAILGMRGKEKLQEAAPLVPEEAAQTVKEDVEWAKTQMKSARK